jgi:Ice-binding-like
VPFKSLSLLFVVASLVPAFGSSINLGTASAFGMLGGTISNTGTSVVNGEVGATITVTGFQPTGPGFATGGVVTGGAAAGPYADFENALTAGSSQASTQTGLGLTTSQVFLGNNVYAFPDLALTTSTAGITLTFDAQSNSSATFVLQFPGALTIDGPITFDLINGALASNIYWIIGSVASPEAATIDPSGVPIVWDGDILAGTVTVSANTGGSGVLASIVNGCVLAVNANTLAGQTVVNGCSAAGTIPEPGSAGLVALGCLLGALGLRKIRS